VARWIKTTGKPKDYAHKNMSQYYVRTYNKLFLFISFMCMCVYQDDTYNLHAWFNTVSADQSKELQDHL